MEGAFWLSHNDIGVQYFYGYKSGAFKSKRTIGHLTTGPGEVSKFNRLRRKIS
jgi:hypothetical protein